MTLTVMPQGRIKTRRNFLMLCRRISVYSFQKSHFNATNAISLKLFFCDTSKRNLGLGPFSLNAIAKENSELIFFRIWSHQWVRAYAQKSSKISTTRIFFRRKTIFYQFYFCRVILAWDIKMFYSLSFEPTRNVSISIFRWVELKIERKKKNSRLNERKKSFGKKVH